MCVCVHACVRVPYGAVGARVCTHVHACVCAFAYLSVTVHRSVHGRGSIHTDNLFLLMACTFTLYTQPLLKWCMFWMVSMGMVDWLDPDPDRLSGSFGSTKVQSNTAIDRIWNLSDF